MIGLFQYYRIVAAYLILLIHQHFWAMPSALERLTCVAVPLFAAVAGFLFAKTLYMDPDSKSFLVKKAKRILIPYIIWALVYWVANSVVLDGYVRHGAISIPGIRSWLLGGTACHLWFLPCLFLTFVLFLLGGKAMNHVEHVAQVENSKHTSRSIRLEIIVFDIVIILLASLSQFIPDATSASLAGYVKIYFGRLVFYFALGSFLSHIICRINKGIAWIIGGGAILIGYGNVVMDWIPGLIWSPLVLVIGLLLIAIANPDIAMPKLVGSLAEASMGIYLVHVLFTSGANVILQKYLGQCPSVLGFVVSVALFIMAYVTVRVLPRKVF